jgi:hypothetical protein
LHFAVPVAFVVVVVVAETVLFAFSRNYASVFNKRKRTTYSSWFFDKEKERTRTRTRLKGRRLISNGSCKQRIRIAAAAHCCCVQFVFRKGDECQ